jgi:hypothetical protein
MTSGPSPVGLIAFDSLRAEDEPWLDRCYVPPPNFDLIAGARSALVFGAPGSGKTALFRALRARFKAQEDEEGSPFSLTVDWRPAPMDSKIPGSTAARLQLLQVFAACAEELLAHLARWPQSFFEAPRDAQETLVWFINRYLGADSPRQVDLYLSRADEPNRSRLHAVLSRRVINDWLAAAKLDLIINEFIKALRQIGPKQVYVLVNFDAIGGSEQVERGLRAFFSSLTLFENPYFVYKIVLPMRLQDSLTSAGGVRRRRLRTHVLSWHIEDLVAIVLERAAVAIGRSVEALTEICEDEQIREWLARTGGDLPRGWLECIAPLVAQWLRRDRPISEREWHTIRARSAPSLVVDLETGEVTVGWRRITDLPEVPLSLLCYLSQHRERVCTRRELYHCAYLPARYPDIDLDEHREYPADDYDSVLDTAISRLRGRIEPDPGSPVYVITERGRGYRLECR